MSISFASSHVALIVVVGGMISASFNTGIEDLLYLLIDKNLTLSIRETFFKCLISGFTVGLLLSIIYYAFAISGFSQSRMTPIQIIGLLTLCFGIANPLLGTVLKLFYSKLAGY